MDIATATIARLKTTVAQLRQVGGAMELDDVLTNDARIDCPAAFVVPLDDLPGGDEAFTGRVIQRVTGTVAIVLCLDNYRDELGEETLMDLNQLRVAVRKALLGWVPDAETGEPVTAGSGRLMEFTGGRTWWADEYQIVYYWSEEP